MSLTFILQIYAINNDIFTNFKYLFFFPDTNISTKLLFVVSSCDDDNVLLAGRNVTHKVPEQGEAICLCNWLTSLIREIDSEPLVFPPALEPRTPFITKRRANSDIHTQILLSFFCQRRIYFSLLIYNLLETRKENKCERKIWK